MGNKLASVVVEQHYNGHTDLVRQYDYTWVGDKLVRREEYSLPQTPNSERRVLRLAFDYKRRPDVLGRQPVMHYEHYWDPMVEDALMPVPHNLVSVLSDLYENGELVSAGYYLYTYTYNSQGLPLLQTTTYNHGRKKEYRFTYQCQ